MKNKRMLALLLAGLMCAGSVIGCGGAQNAAEKESTQMAAETVQEEAEVQETAAAQETEEQAATDDLPSWKRDTTPIEVDWFVAYDWYGKVFDPVNNLADKQLQTETGITINIMTGNTDKLNALIVSGDLPDIVTFDASASQRVQMENGGLVMNLDELAEQYAPDLNVPQSQKDWYRNEDGNWYSLVSYYYGEERCNDEFGGFLVSQNCNFVRTDLLEQIGMTMEDLRTKDGFYEALKKVKDMNLQYDGMDVVPLTGINASSMALQLGVQMEDSEGNLLETKLQPEYLEAVKFYNQMYREGILTSEEFTQDRTQRNQKIASGQVFMAQGWTTVKEPRKALYSSDPNAKILYASTIETGDSGKQHYLASSNSSGWTATLISKSAEHPERIITLFSYLTQESVTLDEEYGIGCYDIVDGKVVRHPEAVAEYAADYNAAYNKYNMNMTFAVDYTINQKYENTDIEDELELDRIKMERSDKDSVFDDKIFTDVRPEAGSDLAAIKTSIDEYWSTMEPQMIMAASEEECEALYNQAVEQINAMGFEQLYEYQNARFQENKAKLGLEFAWPSLRK